MRVIAFLIGISLSQFIALQANSLSTVYQWIDKRGVLSFTNVEARVPAVYKDEVTVRVVDGLDSYPKYSTGIKPDA